ISSTEGVSSWQGQQGSSSNGLKRSPTVSILNMIRNDKRLDGMFDAGFQAKLNVVMSSRVSLLKSYLGMWVSQSKCERSGWGKERAYSKRNKDSIQNHEHEHDVDIVFFFYYY